MTLTFTAAAATHFLTTLCMFAVYLNSEALVRLAMPRRGDPSGRAFVSTFRLSQLFRETISETFGKDFSMTHCKRCKLEFSTLKRSIVTPPTCRSNGNSWPCARGWM